MVRVHSLGEREREREILLAFVHRYVWYTRDNAAINIFYRRTCAGRVSAPIYGRSEEPLP